MMAQKIKKTNSKEEIRDVFRVFDKDGDGFISAEELRHLMTNFGERVTDEVLKEKIRDVFRVLDKDGDGFISVEKLRHLMTNLGERVTDEVLKEIVREADFDGDGQINYGELEVMMTSHSD
ncbi:putative Calmodulin [Hypsibius exemplaris]|uniref:Calmodulin n=1 Tax=Hypsibius exemplaris TaxID=2072580 RepID=A0A9X6RKL9_HYPEX|nr:putative Calmodulin [Hypsibius exemplaris]